MVNAEINSGSGVVAFYRIIENAEGLFKFRSIVIKIFRIHIIPNRRLIDFVGNHPAGNKTVLAV